MGSFIGFYGSCLINNSFANTATVEHQLKRTDGSNK